MNGSAIGKKDGAEAIPHRFHVCRRDFLERGKDIRRHHSGPDLRVISGSKIAADDFRKVARMTVRLVQREGVKPRPQTFHHVQPKVLPAD